MTLKQGEPQRSVLSPLIFIFYVDDLASAVRQKIGTGANSCATIFNSLGGSSSGLHAFVGFRDESCFSTPAVLIFCSGISGNGDCPLSGTFIFCSGVNTDKNYSLHVSAFSISVVHSFV